MKELQFEDIRGYEDFDVERVVNEILSSKKEIKFFIDLLLKKKSRLFRYFVFLKFFRWLKVELPKVKTISDFQERITNKGFNLITKYSIDEVTVSGLEKISDDQGYFFISNHRDIILDAALFCQVLLQNKMNTCYNAIGNNLLTNKLFENLLRINKCFIVKRNLPMRDQFAELKILFQYINHLLEDNKSVWIAQRDGRSKDGMDKTKASILKMLNFSKREKGVLLSPMTSRYNIIPLSISYEVDPCDYLKAQELYAIHLNGVYDKKPGEDLYSILKGMKGYKGRIHIAIGDVLSSEEGKTENDIALEIDRVIHKNYSLWPINFLAWDRYNHSDRFKDRYDEKTVALLEGRLSALEEEMHLFLLLQYANPVQNQLNEGVLK